MIRKKYIKHIVSSYLQIGVQIVIPLLLLPLMVETLEKELYGLWVLFGTIVGYFGLTGFGFGTTFLKEVSKRNDYEYISRYFSTTLFFYIMISIFAVFIFLYLFLYLDEIFLIPNRLISEAKFSFIVFFIAFFINFISGLFGTLLFARGMLQIQNYISIVTAIISGILMFIALYYGYKLIVLSLINLLVSMIFSVYTYYIVNKNISFAIKIIYFDFSLLKEMVKPSMHYFVITVSAMIILNSDNIIISSFIGIGSVTVYAIGYKLVSVSQQILFKVVDIMIPTISKLYDDSKYMEILRLHNKTLLFSLILGFFGYGFLFVYGDKILEAWIGSQYIVDKNIFNIFLAFGLLHTGVHVSAIFLVAMGWHEQTSYMTMLDAFLNIVLSMMFMEYYGLLGVALGTLVAHTFTSAWFTSWWFYKKINIKISENLDLK